MPRLTTLLDADMVGKFLLTYTQVERWWSANVKGGKLNAREGRLSTAANAEQLLTLDADALGTLRSKQLRALLEHLKVPLTPGLDKPALVALVVKHRP